MADRFGGKWIFGVSILGSSVMSLLSPAAARVHYSAFVLLRILSGLSAGFIMPSRHALVARWSTPRNRSVVVAILLVGKDAGVVVGLLAAGVLCQYGFAGGWPSVFYVFGAVGCLASGAWFVVGADSPSTHRRISTVELDYWDRTTAGKTPDRVDARPPSTPWRRLLTSVPLWALAAALFTGDWGFNVLSTCIPLFMHDVLGFDIAENGALSAVPFLASGLVIPLGWFADWLRAPGRMSTNVVRKVFCATGFVLSGCMLVLIGYVGCDRVLVVALMFVAFACSCVAYPAIVVNPLDLAPLHAGKIMGLTNTVACLAQIVAPHAVGALTYHGSTRREWQNVFYLTAAIYAFGAVVFVTLGSGNRQDWNDDSVTVET